MSHTVEAVATILGFLGAVGLDAGLTWLAMGMYRPWSDDLGPVRVPVVRPHPVGQPVQSIWYVPARLRPDGPLARRINLRRWS